ncbi:MAG: hypothetical protein ACJZ8O_10930 [Pirellulaceae bacterium]
MNDTPEETAESPTELISDTEDSQPTEFQYEPSPFKVLNIIVLTLLAFGLYIAIGSFIAWDREGDEFGLNMKLKRFGWIAGCSLTFIAFMWLLLRKHKRR